MKTAPSPSLPHGFLYKPEYLGPDAQKTLIDAVAAAVRGNAPFYRPSMPRTGQPLSVVMSNFGPLGWVTDKDKGYRYQATHPKTGKTWPPMPDILLETWNTLTHYPAPPDACLINWYQEGSKMGMHIDRDEYDLGAPIVSISLGDKARYRLGGPERGGTTMSLKLSSGDVVVLADHARKCYHGVDKIFYGSSRLVPKGGRINLTLRRVNKIDHKGNI
ncbi:MAG TPA: alpha-ketoglutarate-dependent dioxygenase AlkB [Hellea balneolensis]|uniref:Alpha-ketoglutarate-dependent dioxygenase AlkB n=1 Tax=Hellea balneolensis TaxID=287478 RepID=A0A7C5QV60_9PROT|nr:alpha-ketoglutarate-dependent dioxygenase AlkB [Hellea balneolensis]